MNYNSDYDPQELCKQTSFAISNILRGFVRPDEFEAKLAFAYCALLANKFGFDVRRTDMTSFLGDLIEDRAVYDFIASSITKYATDNFFRVLDKILSDTTEDGLKLFISEFDGTGEWDKVWSFEHSTPADICQLALRLMSPNPGSRIGDYGSGRGTFLRTAGEKVENASLFGIEINSVVACASRVRLSISRLDALAESYGCEPEGARRAVSESLDVDIRVGDMFDYYGLESCDYAFSNYPLGMRTAELAKHSGFARRAQAGELGYRRPMTADWIFNHYLVDSIADHGKAVALMTGGACYNTTDSGARRYFIEHGLIEAVVTLPARLFPGTGLRLNMVVLSRGNSAVRMVDASDLVQEGRRTNRLSDGAIEEIVRRIANDADYRSKSVGIEELASSDYVLSPSRFLKRPLNIKNAKKLSEVVLEIQRGATLRAGVLDEMAVNEATDIRYLMLRDIQDGTISDELPYLSGIDKKLEKHCISDGDVLLSKNGAPFKVAVAEVPDNTKLLANGNLYIIRVNRDLVDPYYLAAFLGSNKGMEVLSAAVVGVTIPSIPLRTLKDVQVPVPPLDEQRKTVAEYQAKLDEIRVLKMRAQRAVDEVRSMFDGED